MTTPEILMVSAVTFFGLAAYYLIFPMKLFIISFYKIIKGVIK
ncbi:putative membrane protein [Pseudomonas phage Ka1]|nr:putative membrane protein [Pseudomonas phage Ka1]